MLEHIRDGKPRQRTWKLRGKRRKRPPDGVKRAGKKLALNGTLTNLEALAGLARIGATIDEAAVFFEVSQPTVNARFRSFPALRLAWDQGRANSSISLRRLLFDRAKQPNGGGAAAALFLAKMLLWPRDDAVVAVAPPEKAACQGAQRDAASDALRGLTPDERVEFAALMMKLGGVADSNNGGDSGG